MKSSIDSLLDNVVSVTDLIYDEINKPDVDRLRVFHLVKNISHAVEYLKMYYNND